MQNKIFEKGYIFTDLAQGNVSNIPKVKCWQKAMNKVLLNLAYKMLSKTSYKEIIFYHRSKKLT